MVIPSDNENAALGGGVIVLENEPEVREPSEEEVREYAEFLGIDIAKEPHLEWIARQGVVAPVPHPWKACTENGEDVFYFNFETAESVWDHPCDETYRNMAEEHRKKYEEEKGKPATSVELGDSVEDCVQPRANARGEGGTVGLDAIAEEVSEEEGLEECEVGVDSESSPTSASKPASQSSSGANVLTRQKSPGATREPDAAGGSPTPTKNGNDDNRAEEQPREGGPSVLKQRLELITQEISDDSGGGSDGEATTAVAPEVQTHTDGKTQEKSLQFEPRDRCAKDEGASAPSKGTEPQEAEAPNVAAGQPRMMSPPTSPQLCEASVDSAGDGLSSSIHAPERGIDNGMDKSRGVGGETKAADRGLAGVGLAAPRNAVAVGQSVEEEASVDADSSYTSEADVYANGSASASASASNSGARPPLQRGPQGGVTVGLTAGGGAAVGSTSVALNGHSGKNSSSNLSEVSEDLASEFDVTSPTHSSRQGDIGLGRGAEDTFELSVSAFTAEGSVEAKPQKLTATTNAASAMAATTAAAAGTAATRERWKRAEAQVQSLTRSLRMLKEIREKQQDYLRVLQAGV